MKAPSSNSFRNPVLAVLATTLALQIVTYCVLLWIETDTSTTQHTQALSQLSAKSIEEVHIVDYLNNSVTLKRTDEGWRIPQLGNLPADSVKVAALFSALQAQPSRWPVAETASSAQRFEVANKRHQHKVTLRDAQGNSEVIYLGTVPGLRQVHARNAEQAAIYAITFGSVEAAALAGRWLAPKLLAVRTPLQILGEGYSLEYADGSWRNGLGIAVDESEILAFTEALRALEITGMANGDTPKALANTEADTILEIVSLTGKTTLKLYSQDDAHFITHSQHAHFFTVSRKTYDLITALDSRLLHAEMSPP